MTGFRFPNETDDYRSRRNELLELEKGLRDQIAVVAEKRRELPLGGRLKEDYRFEQMGPDGTLREVAFAQLFGQHDSLLIYSMMFGPDWDAPCPSCTSLVDGFNANYDPVSKHCAMPSPPPPDPSRFATGRRLAAGTRSRSTRPASRATSWTTSHAKGRTIRRWSP